MTTAQTLDEMTEEQLAELLADLDEESLIQMHMAAEEIEQRLIEDGPSNDEELWLWVKINLGIEIPRVPVCDGHDSPFDLLKDAYFSRYPAFLAVGNRGGGKTFIVALLHWLNSEFKPGIEGVTFGATEAQSLRCYAHLKDWIYDDDGERRAEIASSIMRETTWRKKPGYKKGSKVEVLAGTPDAVNGPHPQVAHADEVELMRQDTWDESRNMAVSKAVVIDKGNEKETIVYPSMEILTSTRKSLHGRMQELIDGVQEAIKSGMRPEYKLIVWCIFEIAAEVPDCQMADDDDRVERLEELGVDPCSKCECHLIMKGKWDDKKPRLLKDVCKGRLFKSRGYLPYADVRQKFQQNSQFTWEAQQECSRPETEHNYLKGFSDERHGVMAWSEDRPDGFTPDPANGRIFESIDWGGTNPHAVNLYQLLDFEIEVLDFYDKLVKIKEGSLVCFDEIYVTEIGVDDLATKVKAMEQKYRVRYGDAWKVEKRFADPQGKSQRLDFKKNGLPCDWKTTRDFDTQIEWLVREFWEADRIRFVLGDCPMFSAEAQSWQRDPKTGKQIDEFNHCMSDLRYCVANIRTLTRREKRGKGRRPASSRSRYRTAQVVTDTRNRLNQGPVGIRGGRRGPEDWRRQLGRPDY